MESVKVISYKENKARTRKLVACYICGQKYEDYKMSFNLINNEERVFCKKHRRFGIC